MRLISLVATLVALALLPAAAAQAAPKLVKLRFSTQSYSTTEPASGTSTFTATVLRSGNTRVPASVDYTTQDGTGASGAVAGADYVATGGTLNFAANETRKTITVTVLHNGGSGPASKRLSITLSNGSPTAVPNGQKTATVTILDTDGPGTIDFSSASYSVVEGAGVATITVTRASNSSLVESVDYQTSDGTATAGSDYTAQTGTLTFNAGETSKSFQVPIVDDNVYENDETVSVTLSNPQNITTPLQPPVLGATAAAGPATLTILDDDTATFSFAQATDSVAENIAAPHLKTITVTRGGDLNASADIGYAVDPQNPGTATGGGVDYTLASGTLHFDPGVTTQSFDVTIADDQLLEGNETIGLLLTKGSTRLATEQLSIVDDEAMQPSVQFSNSAYAVGEAAGHATVTVALSKPAVGGETISYATSDTGDAAHATVGEDYSDTHGTITFTTGQTQQAIDIPITNDATSEDDEDFSISLSGGSGLQLGDPHQATVTILDDDGAGTLGFSSLRYDVNENAGSATITVNRTGGSSGSASVDYATSDGTAHDPGDYTSTHGTLSFADGETQKTFQIPVAWDGRQEGDETVSVNLSNFDSDDDPGATKAAVLHIADDGASGPVQFSAPRYDVIENAGAATITVNRSGGSLGGPVTVDYAGSDGTSGTLTFGPGDASRTFQVPVTDDRIHQGPRTVNLSLANPGGGTSLGSQSSATLTIGDDDPVSSSSSRDLTAPKVKLTIKKSQKVDRLKRLVIKVRSSEAAKLGVTADLRKGKKLVRLVKTSKHVAQNKTVTLTLRLGKTALGKLRAALAANASHEAKITVAVTATDAAGNKRTIRKTVSVR